jgi:phosphoribulokinase
MPLTHPLARPVVLGIVGDSAAGKTTLARGIATILGPERVTVVGTDNYLRHSRAERAELGLSALNPAASHIDILEQHLRLLRDGQPVLMPTYDFSRGMPAPPRHVQPRDYIIVEGLLGYQTRALRDCYDVKVFLDPDAALRQRWKLKRDCAERGYTAEEVLAILDRRRADSAAVIQPQRTFADMVVRFFPPPEEPEENGARLNVRHALRPTLPHPNLSPLIDAGGKSGFRLTLARDVDGKPVDVLDISSDIGLKRARAVADLLWSLIPEAGHLRAELGQYVDERNEPAVSYPLELSQLLVTYHLVKAALGHTVV